MIRMIQRIDTGEPPFRLSVKRRKGPNGYARGA
jgi:hypothetical protein